MDVLEISLTTGLLIIILSLCLALLVVVRRQKAGSKVEDSFDKNPVQRRKRKGQKPFNPLRGVSFDNLINHNELSEKISANAISWIEDQTGEVAPSSGPSSLKKSRAKTVRALSAQRLVDTATAMVPSVVAQASPIIPVVIGCVHFLAGIDKLGPFRKFDEKIDRLGELRALDRLASLQAVFEELKGELSSGTSDENHLKTLRLKLKETRISLKNEIRAGFEAMQPPLPRAFLWWRWGVAQRRKNLRDQIYSELSRLREVQVAIHLEQIVWLSLGQSTVFIEEIAPDIVADLKQIGELAHSRVGWVKGSVAKELSELKALPLKMAENLELNDELDLRDFHTRHARKTG